MREENRVLYDRLTADLRSLGRVAVAFSSGVDSTLLLKAAVDALGSSVLAVTARSRSFPERENLEAAAFCRGNGVEQVVVEVDQLSIEGFRDNPPDRCYICKKQLFTAMMEAAAARGFHVIAEGSNMDDLSDYRPGLKAIARRRSGRSPGIWVFRPGKSSLLPALRQGLYMVSTSRTRNWTAWIRRSSF